jgi:hypothetical protein
MEDTQKHDLGRGPWFWTRAFRALSKAKKDAISKDSLHGIRISLANRLTTLASRASY